jgi:hypothetical protein
MAMLGFNPTYKSHGMLALGQQGLVSMTKIRIARLWSIAVAMTLFALPASADAGVPMLFVTFPAMVIALIPIVLVETIIFAKFLKARAAPFAKSVAIANVDSTIV